MSIQQSIFIFFYLQSINSFKSICFASPFDSSGAYGKVLSIN